VAEGGADATWQTAGWVRIFTDADPVVYTTPLGGETVFVLDVNADIDRDPDSGVVNGGGSMTSGEYTLTYGITGLTVDEGSDWPTAGTVNVATQGHTVEITFVGTVWAMLLVDTTEAYEVNLNSGETRPFTP